MAPGEEDPLFGVSEIGHREMELLHATAMPAMRTAGLEATAPVRKGHQASFKVGDDALVAKRAAFGDLQNWPIAASKFYGPCRVVWMRHPRYTLVSPHKRYSRKEIHGRRLVLYKRLPASLQ